ncbi:hypothetical protein A3A93_03730 [Candidatus Roizmanbacteria bacterium RIFCSPLOWO2_01_FULL_38_12]|uniref:Uncharacterized protein n=1 Tax=Candidatus Roizmanbacteria bacterium RIFCSPLOWO2_01_FULL_38_12 TaxID=1802061 RepID=A0A1F7IYW4_9BACT|nr:MAG: hypothetical protein A2861_02890 [Candidatus Roizmanbacteria bacterium RIFCSPHIGHO2_01_FULL_38_15]OGK34411.1 MAG: hypothetical protein A3F59_02315 [Candidatus Roizmanbacteria bacterium RIFCSPHIGHO2_12_FULL_38_13]OGK48544.1 MAG: hypothetical protein A3A93_03730 [Candidatus Roizmanbacteria bacterium RIFCSPLOWO2_01_FULL_38_12]
MIKTITTDIVVIGAGGAGLRASIEAVKMGARLAVISKEPFGRAHTEKAMGGLNVAIKPPASPEQHYQDTIKGGWYLNNHKLVHIFTHEMPDRIYDLVSYGVKFDRLPDGSFYTWAGGKQSAPLNLCAGDYTGREMMHGLASEVKKLKVPFYAHYFVTKIFADKKGVYGVYAFNQKNNRPVFFHTKAVIAAAGGAGQLYKITSNEPSNTGEGYVWGFNIGAELQDMEFIQFHPTGMAFPESEKGSLITEKVRGHKGKLINSKGERFMKRYQPERMELAGRDEVARAIYTEVQEGRGTKHGGVYLDVRELGLKDIKKHIPEVYAKFKKYGVDISREMMEITPTMHHMMGGIRFNEWGETNIPGFYAIGEVGTGIHGANRLGGNSLAEGQVFARRTGISSSIFVSKIKHRKFSDKIIKDETKRLDDLVKRTKGISFKEIRKELGSIMWDKVGIVRDEKTLVSAAEDIESLIKKAAKMKATKKTLQPVLETFEMVKLARIIIACAIVRKESRGAHFRSDYPKMNKKWEKNIIVKNVSGKIKTIVRPTIKL